MLGVRYLIRGILVGTASLVLAAFPSGSARAGKMPRKPVNGATYRPAGPPDVIQVERARRLLASTLEEWGVPPIEASEWACELPPARAVELGQRLDAVQAGGGLGPAYVILISLVALLLILDLLDEGIFIGKAAGAKQKLMADLGGTLPWLDVGADTADRRSGREPFRAANLGPGILFQVPSRHPARSVPSRPVPSP